MSKDSLSQKSLHTVISRPTIRGEKGKDVRGEGRTVSAKTGVDLLLLSGRGLMFLLEGNHLCLTPPKTPNKQPTTPPTKTHPKRAGFLSPLNKKNRGKDCEKEGGAREKRDCR